MVRRRAADPTQAGLGSHLFRSFSPDKAAVGTLPDHATTTRPEYVPFRQRLWNRLRRLRQSVRRHHDIGETRECFKPWWARARTLTVNSATVAK